MYVKTLVLFFFSLLITSCDRGAELANEAPTVNESCGSDHPLVGQTRALSTRSHQVRGDVTIVSNCEIEISNFNYDGGGPDVHVYGGTGGNFSQGVNMSEGLNGPPVSGATVRAFLPESTSLDEINSFSIWCVQFSADFGSVNFAL